MSKKLTIGFVKEQFEKEGYSLLTKEYINNHKSLEYICPNGHCWSITWNSWQQGTRCVECSGLKKLTIDFIREQFKKEGYTLLSKKYINALNKLEYYCPKKHKRSIRWNDWQQGKRCAKCDDEVKVGENNPNWNPNLTDEDR